MIKISYLIIIILLAQPIQAYYIGYGNYGMNHNITNNLINEFPKEDYNNLTAIIFTNSICVAKWGGECNAASFEYKGKNAIIKIGRFNIDDYDTLKIYMKHELTHLKQWRNGAFKGYYNGFNQTIENEANR